MANRYWVGGTGPWTTINSTNWSETSGGTGGASVPGTEDIAIFNSASGTGTVTVSGTLSFGSLLVENTYTGTITGSGALIFNQDFSLSSTVSWGVTGGVAANSSAGNTQLVKTSGKTLFTFSAGNLSTSNSTVSLQDALTLTSNLSVNAGSFLTNGYSITAVGLLSSNSNIREINLGSSTLTLSGATAINFGNPTNLTFNAGTSNIVVSNTSASITGGGLSFYNITYGSNAGVSHTYSGVGSARNLTIVKRSTAGVLNFTIFSDSIITNVLSIPTGSGAVYRTFIRSGTVGTNCTLTCNSTNPLVDIDFRDITFSGAAAPVSGTRLGDCKGNFNITFDAPKTVYWNGATGGNWSQARWALTPTGSASTNNLPLAQDTAIISNTGLNSGSTIGLDNAFAIGNLDMSGRSLAFTLSLSTTTPDVYGHWINGTGTTMTGTSRITFSGRNVQNLTTAGKTWTTPITIISPGGSLVLQDAFTSSSNSTAALTVSDGTFDANNYNVTFTGSTSRVVSSGNVIRTINIGSGTWTFANGGTSWDCTTSTNLTVTGTGTLRFTSPVAKTFVGGNIQTYPNIVQAGTGQLIITGSNKFISITNTAVGRVSFTGGTTNEFLSFGLNGSAGNLLILNSTNTTPAIIKKPTNWLVGANSLDSGNNTGLTFSAGGNDYLNISYINGQVTSTSTSNIYLGSTNITNISLGSLPINSIYYGSIQVY